MLRRRSLRYAGAGLGLLLAGTGLLQLGAAGAIHAKAWLAQVLLERAWADTLAGRAEVRPWPWADTMPVARLRVPELGVDQIVLAGTSGRTLAFGPAHLNGTARPGMPGHSVLSGHRDTHFAFMRNLRPGTGLRVQGPDGTWRHYQAGEARVIDARQAWLAIGERRTALTLVTCYPFDALESGGPLRYVITAESEAIAASLP